MANQRQHREQLDLVAYVAQLERRIRVLEATRRLGNSSIDGGRLTVRGGDIAIANDDGQLAMLLTPGATPAITMIPTFVEGGYLATAFTWESDENGASYQVSVENPSGLQDGGKLLLQRSTAYLARQPNGSSPAEAYLALGDIRWGGNTEHIRFRGRWGANGGFDAQDAVLFGYDEVAAGFGGAIYNFPFTLDKVPMVFCGLYNSGSLVTSWNMTALSTSSFTLSWSGTAAKTVSWVAFRR